MQEAIAIWQAKAARDVAETDERTKPLEQIVFVAVPVLINLCATGSAASGAVY